MELLVRGSFHICEPRTNMDHVGMSVYGCSTHKCGRTDRWCSIILQKHPHTNSQQRVHLCVGVCTCPTVIALTPCFLSIGMAARVSPGTSRCDLHPYVYGS